MNRLFELVIQYVREHRLMDRDEVELDVNRVAELMDGTLIVANPHLFECGGIPARAVRVRVDGMVEVDFHIDAGTFDVHPPDIGFKRAIGSTGRVNEERDRLMWLVIHNQLKERLSFGLN